MEDHQYGLMEKRLYALERRRQHLNDWVQKEGIIIDDLSNLCTNINKMYGDFLSVYRITPYTPFRIVKSRLNFLHEILRRINPLDIFKQSQMLIQDVALFGGMDIDSLLSVISRIQEVREDSLFFDFIKLHESPQDIKKAVDDLIEVRRRFTEEEIKRIGQMLNPCNFIDYTDRIRYILDHPKQDLIHKIIRCGLAQHLIVPYIDGRKQHFPFSLKKHSNIEKDIDLIPDTYSISGLNHFKEVLNKLRRVSKQLLPVI